ncbi:MAG: retroviral-like aspartic protease [Candidatus Cloacimonetes bacterium]|nr:retroviral-like aspartic protease [Candidatus Cloacimonadota bacterium]
MIVEKELLFEGSVGEARITALFDSGSTYSCIRPENAQKIANIEKILHPFKIETASKGHFIEVKHAVRLDFYINGSHFSDEFIVVPNLSSDVIIGAKTLQSWRLKLDFENDEVLFDPKVTQLRLV